jgi:predicted DNA-binding protein (UPF0251 family)
VSCRYHLLLNVASDGRLYSQQQFDESDPVSIAEAVRALDETCALDVAERGEHTFEQVAAVMGIDAKDVFLHAQRAQEKIAVLVSDAHPDDPYFRLMAAQELRR